MKIELGCKRKARVMRRKRCAYGMQREELGWWRRMVRLGDVTLVYKTAAHIISAQCPKYCGLCQLLCSPDSLNVTNFSLSCCLHKGTVICNGMWNDLNNFYFENILQAGICLLRMSMLQASRSQRMWGIGFWVFPVLPDLTAREGAPGAVVSGCQRLWNSQKLKKNLTCFII